MALAFVIAHRQILAVSTESAAKRVFKDPRCYSWKVLIDSVTWYMSHLEGIFLPFRTEGY